MKKLIAFAAGAAAMMAAGTASAETEVALPACSASGPALVLCIAGGGVLQELQKDRPFGPNGELVSFVNRRIQSMKHESAVGQKLVRLVTDISLTDIGRYGIAGGPNSMINQLFK